MTTTKVECVECQDEFETSRQKHEGDIFKCPHCGTKHEVAIDWDEESEVFWYPVRAKTGDAGL